MRAQESCAAAATVAVELLFGASPAWQDASCFLLPAEGRGTRAASAANGSAAISPGLHAGAGAPAAQAQLLRCAESLLETLADERLAGLPTHAEAAAAAGGGDASGTVSTQACCDARLEPAMSASLQARQWHPQA